MTTNVLWRFVLWLMMSLLLIWGCDSLQAQSVHDVARAIAKTEGYYIPGTKPARYHNPGDIRRFRGTAYPGEVGRDRFGYVKFINNTAGWRALESNIQRIVDGTSTYYSVDPTFAEIAKSYATDKRWGATVCKILRINPQATLREYLGLAPRIQLTRNETDGTILMWMFEVGNELSSVRSLFEMSTQVY